MLVTIFLAACVFVFAAFLYVMRTRRELVGHVTSIRTHPVKSGGILKLRQCELTQQGLKHDRQFVVLNEHGTLITLRKHPRFVLFRQSIHEDSIYLDGEDMPTLKLPLSMAVTDGQHTKQFKVFGAPTGGVHVSEEADQWISKFLRLPGCKLYCFAVDNRPRYNIDNNDKAALAVCDQNDILAYADACPLLIVSEASVEELNDHLERKVTVDAFRPNIVVTGCSPRAENDWGMIEIGDTRMKALYPCERCVATTVDPVLGIKYEDNEPLNTLKRTNAACKDKYPLLNGKPLMGYNYGVRKTGVIKVGDPVYKLL